MRHDSGEQRVDRNAIDLLSPEFYVGNPHPAYRWMRDNEPVFRDEKNGLWGITRIADLRAIERSADIFVSSRGYRSVHEPRERSMIAKDDPAHAEQRKLISARFTPRAVRGRETEIRNLAGSCIERVMDRGVAEVVDAWAARIPAILTCRMLGFPDDSWRILDDWSCKLMQVDMTDRDARIGNEAAQAFAEMKHASKELYEARRRSPRNDLISIWAHSDLAGGPMSLETVLWELGLVIPGGIDTTRTMISRSIALLADRPDLWAQMSDAPSTISCAVEELLRYITPLNNMFRTALADAEVGGQPIAAGDRLCLLYPSANRDEAVFRDPDELDLGRSPNPHVAFGLGTHFCLGANLARITLRVFFEELTCRITGLRVRRPPEFEPNVFVKGVRRLEIAFDTV